MSTPAIKLEVLPAGYGDCLLISCPVGRRTWRLRRRLSGPLKVDVFKLSHHGSRANVTQELMRAVQAEHFVFEADEEACRQLPSEKRQRARQCSLLGGRPRPPRGHKLSAPT
jgi:hypothetical protein